MGFFRRYEYLCRQEGKTPTGVAIDLGLSRASVSRWRNGSMPNPEALSIIAKHFDISTDYLLGNTDIKNPPNQSDPEDIAKVALFGGDGEVTEEMWQEMKEYADFVKKRHQKKHKD